MTDVDEPEDSGGAVSTDSPSTSSKSSGGSNACDNHRSDSVASAPDQESAAREDYLQGSSVVDKKDYRDRIHDNVALCIREVLIHKKKYLLKPKRDFDIKSKLSMLVWQYVLDYKKEKIRSDFEIPVDLYEQHGGTVKEEVLKQLSTKRSTIVSNMKKAYCGKHCVKTYSKKDAGLSWPWSLIIFFKTI